MKHVVGPFDELEPGAARRVDLEGEKICVVRVGDKVYAIGDTCSHANISLSEGEVDVDECTVECWKHGSTFSLIDGEPQSLPATQPVPVYIAGVDDGQIVVELS